MRELTSKKLICLKGVLFLVAGALASLILFLQHHDLLTIAMLAIAVWSFARFYYFTFHVIQKYVKRGSAMRQ